MLNSQTDQNDMNRLPTVAVSVPDTEKPRRLRGVSLGQTDLRKNHSIGESSYDF